MKLTDGERLIALMLAEIMDKVGANSEIDPNLLKQFLWNKDDWAIGRKYHWLFGESGDSESDVKETTNILWMWGIIESRIAELEGDEADAAKDWQTKSFRGFDANHNDHHGIAHTIINDLGEFDSFKDRNLDSHSQADLPRYRIMLAMFEEMLSKNDGNQLSFEQLEQLCN